MRARRGSDTEATSREKAPADSSKGGGIAYPLFPCEVLPEVQRQAAP